MTTIPGASQFYSASLVANVRNLAPSTPSLIGELGDSVSLLSVGKKIGRVSGIGISSTARAFNDQYLSRNKGLVNELLSLAAGTDSTMEGALTQIRAIRARTPISQLGPSAVRIEA